ncbi:MAG: DUF5777 family beta-barrel protein [Cyclobacteriaceae bacterium]
MKNIKHILVLPIFMLSVFRVFAQEDTEVVKEDKVIRPMFESAYLMDNQSVVVYPKNTLEFVMQHRFGSIENGISDFFGLYGITNIRLGLTYVPLKNLAVGYGITKDKLYQDFNVKYSIKEQTRSGSMPVSLAYYGNATVDSRAKGDIERFANSTDRLSFYHQAIVARKFNSKLSVQLSPSYTHFNAVPAFLDNGEVRGTMNNDHFAVDISGRYKVSAQGSITVGYNQPITKHFTNNPSPNISFGFEVATSSHAFQVYMGNYWGIVPQVNNFHNQNTNFLIGFNITRLWSF